MGRVFNYLDKAMRSFVRCDKEGAEHADTDPGKFGFNEFRETEIGTNRFYTENRQKEICLAGVMTEVDKGIRVLKKPSAESGPDREGMIIPRTVKGPGCGSGGTVYHK